MNGLGIVVVIAIVVAAGAIWLALRDTPAPGRHRVHEDPAGELPTTSSGRDPHDIPLVADDDAAPTQRNGNGEDVDK
jgi:hypothetical protein